MSRNTENKEELLKVHGSIDLINQRLDTLENNHLAHIQKDIDRIMYVISAIGLGLLGQFLYLY
jgi:Mg2+ and Co2+ transporter CorA